MVWISKTWIPGQVERIREQLGLNDPLPVQYFRYLGRLLQGDLGRSISTRRPIATDLVQRYPATMILALASLLIVVMIALPLGVLSARYRNSWIDHFAMFISLSGVSMPNFWVGIMLILSVRVVYTALSQLWHASLAWKACSSRSYCRRSRWGRA